MRLLPGGLCHLILNSSSKSCELNFLPPFLVKELIDEPTPLLLLCSSLLTQGCVPIIIAEKGFVFSLSSAKALIWIPLQITTPPQTFLSSRSLLKNVSSSMTLVLDLTLLLKPFSWLVYLNRLGLLTLLFFGSNHF